MKEPEFREAAPDDATAIVALVESAYRGESSRAGWTTEADLLDGQRTDLDEVRGLVGGDDSRIVLAIDGAAVVGCASLRRDGDAAWFGMFAVQPPLQGAGIGAALLRECERLARIEWGAVRQCMTVIRGREELIDWYRRRGYAETGEGRPFPYGDPRFGLPRRDDLSFIVLQKAL
jgi:GNAT superfamily N-acetyltransferase